MTRAGHLGWPIPQLSLSMSRMTCSDIVILSWHHILRRVPQFISKHSLLLRRYPLIGVVFGVCRSLCQYVVFGQSPNRATPPDLSFKRMEMLLFLSMFLTNDFCYPRCWYTQKREEPTCQHVQQTRDRRRQPRITRTPDNSQLLTPKPTYAHNHQIKLCTLYSKGPTMPPMLQLNKKTPTKPLHRPLTYSLSTFISFK